MDIKKVNALYENKPKSQLDRSTQVHKTSSGSITITGGTLEHKNAWKTPDSLKDEGVTIRNTLSSIAGAGSGEFHIYRAHKKWEEARLKKMDMEEKAEKEKDAFNQRQKGRDERAQKKTQKNQTKREKQKQKKQREKAIKQLEKKAAEKSDENSSSEPEESIRKKSKPVSDQNETETKRLKVEEVTK